MPDNVERSDSSSKPQDERIARLPFASIGDTFRGQVAIVRDKGNTRWWLHFIKPVPFEQRPERFGRTKQYLVSFLGGATGGVLVIWLKSQPAFWRFMDALPVWP